MNSLNHTTAAHPIHSNAAFPASLFPKGVVFTVIGQVHHWHLGWAGRIECGLRLSIGDLALRANRDTVPMEIGNGSWVRVKLMHRHDNDSAMHVLSAVATVPAPGETSWVPVSLYHRSAGMRELRRLLSTLEPGHPWAHTDSEPGLRMLDIFAHAAVSLQRRARNVYWVVVAVNGQAGTAGAQPHGDIMILATSDALLGKLFDARTDLKHGALAERQQREAKVGSRGTGRASIALTTRPDAVALNRVKMPSGVASPEMPSRRTNIARSRSAEISQPSMTMSCGIHPKILLQVVGQDRQLM